MIVMRGFLSHSLDRVSGCIRRHCPHSRDDRNIYYCSANDTVYIYTVYIVILYPPPTREARVTSTVAYQKVPFPGLASAQARVPGIWRQSMVRPMVSSPGRTGSQKCTKPMCAAVAVQVLLARILAEKTRRAEGGSTRGKGGKANQRC